MSKKYTNEEIEAGIKKLLWQHGEDVGGAAGRTPDQKVASSGQLKPGGRKDLHQEDGKTSKSRQRRGRGGHQSNPQNTGKPPPEMKGGWQNSGRVDHSSSDREDKSRSKQAKGRPDSGKERNGRTPQRGTPQESHGAERYEGTPSSGGAENGNPNMNNSQKKRSRNRNRQRSKKSTENVKNEVVETSDKGREGLSQASGAVKWDKPKNTNKPKIKKGKEDQNSSGGNDREKRQKAKVPSTEKKMDKYNGSKALRNDKNTTDVQNVEPQKANLSRK